MIDHHLGGIHMADYAEQHATPHPRSSGGVTRWSEGQLGDIAEMNRWRVQHGFEAVKVPDSLSHS